MRFTRMTGAELRSDPARLADAMRARGFFPGQRAVLLEEATDTLGPIIAETLENWSTEDAFLVITAGALTPRGALRKLFEPARNACILPIYADPPDRADVENMLAKAGVPPLSRAAQGDLETLARALDPGDLAQLIEKLALYCHGASEVSEDDVAAIAPKSLEAEADAVVAAVATGNVAALPPLMARMVAQGSTAVSLLIAVTRHFRQLYAAAVMGGGEDALGRLRPPVMGPRRRAMGDQLRRWSVPLLEAALKELMDCDLTLRSARSVPETAYLERSLVRVAMMSARRGR
jgi:DNA polymerase-3 subunit delta